MFQYRETNQTNHLLNAGKYATSLVAIFFSTVHLITQGKASGGEGERRAEEPQ